MLEGRSCPWDRPSAFIAGNGKIAIFRKECINLYDSGHLRQKNLFSGENSDRWEWVKCSPAKPEIFPPPGNSPGSSIVGERNKASKPCHKLL